MDDAFYFQGRGASELDSFRRDWYLRSLLAMNEPSLSCAKAMAETYRFLWLRTWERPVAVRFVPDRTGTVLHVVELDGMGGFELGSVSRQATLRLSPTQSEELLRTLADADVWNMPAKDELIGADGARWVLEARRGDSYRVIDRWSPESGEYRALCELLIRQAGVELDSDGDDLY